VWTARFNDNLAIIESSVERIKVRLATTVAESLANTFVEFGIGVDDAARRVEVLERRLKGLRAPGFVNQTFGRPLAEALLGKTADEIELEILDLRTAIDELGDTTATDRALKNFRGGGDTTTSKKDTPTAAETDLQRRLEGLRQLEQEFLDAESVRTFQAQQLTGVQAASLDLSRDQTRETERLREAWLRLGAAGTDVLSRLTTGTLGWRQALGLVFQELRNVLRAIAQANKTGEVGEGFGLAGSILGIFGSAIGGGGFGGFGSAAGFQNFFRTGSPIITARAATPTGGAPFVGGGIGGTAGFTFHAEGGITTRPIIGEAGPEAIIPLDRMGDVMRDIAPMDSNAIASRIQAGGAATVPPDVKVILNAPLLDPRAFRPTDEEIITVVVNGYEYHMGLRDATGREISRRSGR